MDDTPAAAPKDTLVRLVGTGHVFPLRSAVQAQVFSFRPAVVALELDAARLQGLLTPPERRGRAAKQGVGYGLMARFQEKMAKDFGGSVGDEMLAAREAALVIGSGVALIDRPVDVTYRRLLAEMSAWEKLRLAGSALLAIVPGKWGRADIDRVLEGDPTLVAEVQRHYPTLVRVLLHERNDHMAHALRSLAGKHPRVLAVMGDAHVPGVEALLRAEGIAAEAVRLTQLRAHAEKAGTSAWGFRVDAPPP